MVSTWALVSLSASPARTPLFASVPCSVASGTAPTLSPFLLLGPLSLFRAFSPAVSLSPKVLKLHVLELGSHRGFVLVSCFDDSQRLVGQGG